MKKLVRKNQLIITALAVMIAVAGYLNFTGQELSKDGLKKASVLLKPDKTGTKEANEKKSSGQETVDVISAQTDQADQSAKTSARTDQTDQSAKTSARTGQTNQSAKTDISEEDMAGEYEVADSGELQSVSEEHPGEAVMVSNALGADFFSSARLSREQNRAKNKETLMGIINNEKIASKDKKSAIDQVAKLTENAQLESAAELMLEAKGFPESVVSVEKGSADVVINAQDLTEQQLAQITDIVTRKTGVSADHIVITPVSVSK